MRGSYFKFLLKYTNGSFTLNLFPESSIEEKAGVTKGESSTPIFGTILFIRKISY